jgi:hypothetical protein
MSWDGNYGYDGGYVMAETNQVAAMSYTQLVKWIRKTNIEDIAEVMFDLIDRVNMLEEQQLDFNEDGLMNPYYDQFPRTGTL